MSLDDRLRCLTWLTDARYRTRHLLVMSGLWVAHLAVHYATYVPPLREPLNDWPYVWLHTLHEAAFVLLVIYASLVFRLKGGMIATALTAVASLPFLMTPTIFGTDPGPDETRDLFIQVGFILLMGAMAAVLYEAVGAERQRYAALARQVEEANRQLQTKSHELERVIQELQSSRRRIITTQQEVRREIAERLHGHVQSRLLVATQFLREAQEGSSSPEDSAALITKAMDLIDDVNQNDLRGIARRLHPSIVRLGLVPALRSLADSFAGSLQIEIRVHEKVLAAETPGSSTLPEEMRLAVYRVVEEALNNVQKHAAASRVDLIIDWPQPDRLTVTVRDDGRGFDDKETRAGLGLLAMRDYSSLLGGTTEIESRVGKGTTIRASFPMPAGVPAPAGAVA